MDLGLEVTAPAGARTGLARRRTRSPTRPPEQVAEQVAEAAHVARVAGGLPPDAAARAAEPPGAGAGERVAGARRHHLADFVVLLALGRVAEDVIGGRDVLELLLRLLVAGVGIWVVLLGQLPVGAGDVLLGCPLLEPEYGVVVLLEPLPLRSHLVR
jgi:hypothetical protein